MKNKLVIALILLGLLLVAGACTTVQGAKDTIVPDNKVSPAPNKYLVIASAEDFSKEANITKQVEVKAGDTFTITLDSNATTGFQWNEQAQIADTKVLTQEAHQYVAPATNNGSTPVAGMSGIEEWTFTAGQTGTTTAFFSYDRPWEGGEKAVRTFELTVVVK
jgi:predicted secreted protein/predicted small secreted protein